MSQSLVVSVLVFPMILDCILNGNVDIQDPRESTTRNTCSLIVVQHSTASSRMIVTSGYIQSSASAGRRLLICCFSRRTHPYNSTV